VGLANDWSKAGDRDVNGYIDVMRQQVKGEWTVHHQLGHVEKRKKYRWKVPWTMAEWGNWVADGNAGRARKIAEMEEKEWVASVDKWNTEVDRRERTGGIAKAVAKPVHARAVPLLPAWKLANSMYLVLCWEDLEVCITGPTVQSGCAKHYRTHTPLTTCESSLLVCWSLSLTGNSG
jgi:hypothetical protein